MNHSRHFADKKDSYLWEFDLGLHNSYTYKVYVKPTSVAESFIIYKNTVRFDYVKKFCIGLV